jgi:phage tail-like protein
VEYRQDMPGRREEPLLRASAFEVRIGGRDLGFAEVGPLRSETVTDEATGRPGHRLEPVVLRRALTRSTELYDWRRAIVEGKDDRRDVTIRQLSMPGGKPVNAWRLVRAWPSRWSGPSFDAMTDDITYEELELSYEDLIWLTSETTPGG